MDDLKELLTTQETDNLADTLDSNLARIEKYKADLINDRKNPTRFKRELSNDEDGDVIYKREDLIRAQLFKVSEMRRNSPAYRLAQLEFRALTSEKSFTKESFEKLLDQSPIFKEFAQKEGWQQNRRDVNHYFVLTEDSFENHMGIKINLDKDSTIQIFDLDKKGNEETIYASNAGQIKEVTKEAIQKNLRQRLYEYGVVREGENRYPNQTYVEMATLAIFTRNLQVFKSVIPHINDIEIIRGIASNPATPPEFIPELMYSIDPIVQKSILQREGCTLETYIEFFYRDHPDVIAFMAEYQRTPPEIIDAILEKFKKGYNPAKDLIGKIAHRDSLTEQQMRVLHSEYIVIDAVKKGLAKNSTVPEILDGLLQYNDIIGLVSEVALNTSTAPETLAKIMSSTKLYEYARDTAMLNPNAPEADVKGIIDSVFESGKISSLQFFALRTINIEYFEYIYEKSKTIEDEKSKIGLYREMSRNKICPDQITRELVLIDDVSVRANIISNQNPDAETLDYIFEERVKSIDSRFPEANFSVIELAPFVKIANHANVSADTYSKIIAQFAHFPYVAQAIINNQTLPENLGLIYRKLVSQLDLNEVELNGELLESICKIAEHTNTPEITMKLLIERFGYNAEIATTAASKDSVSSEVLDILSLHTSTTARYYVAQHPNTAKKTLLRLVKDIPHVATNVANNISIDSDIIDELMKITAPHSMIPEMAYTHRALIDNPSVPFWRKKEIILENPILYTSEKDLLDRIFNYSHLTPIQIYKIVQEIPDDELRGRAELRAAMAILKKKANYTFMVSEN